MRKFITSFLILASLGAFAQQRDSSLFPTAEELAKAEDRAREEEKAKAEERARAEEKTKTLPPALTGDAPPAPIPYVMYKKGSGAPVDTLDVSDARLKIVICDNNTWYYVKNMDQLEQEDVFTEYWVPDSINPYYKVELSSLPLRNTIILEDEVSHFTCPNQTKVFSKFGYRHGRRHQGVDLPYPTGTPVKAAFDGRVRVSTYSSGYGNLVVIRHQNGLETYYGHLSESKVNVGDWVHSGDIIGLGGSTGRSSGPHLHFETRYKGFAFDPEWIADYETGQLRQTVFVLKRNYLDPSSNYTPESIDEEEDVYTADQKILEEEARREAERAAMKWHTVRNGETISGIAQKNGVSIATIKKLNPKLNVDKISIGQKIRIN